MSALEALLTDKAIRERSDGIKEVIHNHYRWLRFYTGIEKDPAGIVEVGDAFREITDEDRRNLSGRIDRMENLLVV